MGASVPTRPFTDQGKFGIKEYTYSVVLHAKFQLDRLITLPLLADYRSKEERRKI